MKVIGAISDRHYICEVTHAEIEKFMNLYYCNNSMKALRVGDEVNLGKGYDFASQINDAMRKTEDFISNNKKTIEAILSGISVVGRENSVPTWRAMETAPKDGTFILLAEDGIVHKGFFDSIWISVNGGIELEPTHWMPLPQVPEGDWS